MPHQPPSGRPGSDPPTPTPAQPGPAAHVRRRRKAGASEARAALDEAIARHAAGDFAGAEAQCRAGLAIQPASPQLLHVLGIALWQQGQSAGAAQALGQALAIDPNNDPAAIDLANILSEQGDLAAATQLLADVVKRSPASSLALNNYGLLLKRRGELPQAAELFQRAIAAAPADHIPRLNLGYTRMLQEEWSAAAEVFRSVADREPNHLEAIRALARLSRILGDKAAAQTYYSRWAALQPEDPIPAFLLRALSGDQQLQRAPQSYVREEFDRFAESFDDQLARLEYRVPQRVEAALRSRRLPPDRSRVIADLGCGTGLGGKVLRPFAHQLVGVDLSPKMLAKAAARGCYDQLHEQEVCDFLATQPQRFDWLVALDMLIYVGELTEFLARARHAVRPAGTLILTVEQAAAGDTFHLAATGRYQHSADYLRATLTAAGFSLPEMQPIDLRKEAGEVVAGWIVWAAVPPPR